MDKGFWKDVVLYSAILYFGSWAGCERFDLEKLLNMKEKAEIVDSSPKRNFAMEAREDLEGKGIPYMDALRYFGFRGDFKGMNRIVIENRESGILFSHSSNGKLDYSVEVDMDKLARYRVCRNPHGF